jgi:hypothetical protein
MTDPELMERIRELRERGRTPKEIARATGLPPAVVAPLIRTFAAAQPAREKELVACLLNQSWSAGLTVTGHPDWPGADETEQADASGLVSILVARDQGSTVSVCGYLVDVWCLGVKNAIGPKTVQRRKLPSFIDDYYRAVAVTPVAAPLDLARQAVFGAVEYARGLGFEPHPDFAKAAGLLGAWDGVCDIAFGRDGQPMYIQGPYDDASRITRTLRGSVGDGNFGYVRSMV